MQRERGAVLGDCEFCGRERLHVIGQLMALSDLPAV
jgi:hypothetical protein